MAHFWFPDNTVFCNFAAVERLDLLKALLDGRGRWTEAVAFEVHRSAKHLAAMAAIEDDGWLGEPIAVSQAHSERIERIRVAALGGSPARPLEHRGEAETCYVIREVVGRTECVWITDDEAAFDFGKRQGIETWDTTTVIERCVADGLSTLEDAFALLMAMFDQDRAPRRRPAKPQDLC